MKTYRICIIVLLTISSRMMIAQLPYSLKQTPNPFQTDYNFDKKYRSEKTQEYKDIEGSPYLNDEFLNGAFYMNDTVAFKVPIRYNLYTDQMEYQSEGVNYVVGSPQTLSRIVLGGSEYYYLPAIGKGGYFEMLETGKCKLLQKKRVEFKPSEGAKPIVGLTPAKFVRLSDDFYLVKNQNQPVKIVNLKSVIEALQDQKTKIEDFIKLEKIRNTKKENLIKIVKYYNSLIIQVN